MKKITKKKGFTLVETLVAISILLIAIMSPMTIAQSSLSSAGYARNEFVAQYLNQDALEWIKNIKDYSAMVNMGTPGKTTANWLTFNGTLTRCVSGDGSKRCEIDTATSTA
ncbi:MAG: type II secretion system protein, partial [bacterium]